MNLVITKFDVDAFAVGAAGQDGEDGKDGRGIADVEIKDGHLWSTYSDDLEKPVDLGVVSEETDESILEYELLDNNTYGVKAGELAKKVTTIDIPARVDSKEPQLRSCIRLIVK
ncbi:MAG: hypothetical protein IJN34_06340 [Clostridia bacterium]|nr:hypothetical protein [Clostridia bacterium]